MHPFAFMRGPLPSEGSRIRPTLVLMRVEGWIRLLQILFAITSIFMTRWLLDQAEVDYGSAGEGFEAIMNGVMIVVTIFGIMFAIGFFLWMNYVFEQVQRGKSGAETKLFMYGLVVAILGGLGLFGILINLFSLGTYGPWYALYSIVSSAMTVGLFVFGILYAIAANNVDFKTELMEQPLEVSWR